MNEFKGTPGKWFSLGDGIVYVEDTKRVYDSPVKLGSGWIEDAWADDKADDEVLANANLVAAAPDLLEACDEIYAWATKDGDAVDLNRALEMIDAAIKKALQS